MYKLTLPHAITVYPLSSRISRRNRGGTVLLISIQHSDIHRINFLNIYNMKRNYLRILFSLVCLAALIPASAQIFYKVEGNGLAAPSYLFGTHHMAPADFTDRFTSLPEARENAQAVVGEIDMTGNPMQLQMEMARYMQAPADSTLSKLMTPEEFNELNEKFKPLAPMPGLDLSMLDGMRPMVPTTMVTLTLVQKSMPGFDPTKQLDATFQADFKKAGKKVIPLETAAQQAELLYTFTPIAKQLEALRETLADTEKAEKAAIRLNEAYMAQDLDAMMAVSKEEEGDGSEFMEALIDRRNHDWMTRIPAIMSDQPSLIVVGALHLAGEEGLVNLLRRQGYTVTPMK